MAESDIKQLLNDCIDSNRAAQKQLYKQFYGLAMGICLRYSNNRYEASQLVNQGFMKVFNNLHQYDYAYPFRSWLGKIMVNTAIGNYRQQLKGSEIDDLDTDDEAKVEIPVDSELNYHDLLIMVQQLSVICRVVFNLFVIDGYSHEEISEILNISIGTSKANLFKARLKLKFMIAKLIH
ncbi:MAG: sigma-70 family RNA polymerase sigma factor [Bacteroidota bacterium]|nr:sigma-70 family RNA polymerase sigma factor [Bacteroidota bacterium]